MTQGINAARAYLEKLAHYKTNAGIASAELEHLKGRGQPFLSMYGPKYARMIQTDKEARQRAAEQIAALNNPLHRDLLAAYYLHGRTLEQIADALFYSPSYIRAVHSRALDAFYRQHLATDAAKDKQVSK